VLEQHLTAILSTAKLSVVSTMFDVMAETHSDYVPRAPCPHRNSRLRRPMYWSQQRYTHSCIYCLTVCRIVGPVAQSLYRLSYRAGRSGIESRWGRDFPPVQTGPGTHPASCKMGTGSFSGVKYGRSVLLTTHPLLVPRSWKSTAIPLPTLWATPGLLRDHFTYSMLKCDYASLHINDLLP